MSKKNKKTNPKKKQDLPIEIDPAVLLDCIDEVDIMVNAHVNLLQAVKRLVLKFRKNGLSPQQATAAAFELHKRASNKANSLVPNGQSDEEKKDEAAEKEEEESKDDDQ